MIITFCGHSNFSFSDTTKDELKNISAVCKKYDIPFSAMCPLECDNLITAGRCISGTHISHSSYRVMRICMAMGQAAGVAASIMCKTDTNTNTVDTDLIRKHLINRGVALEE